MPLTSFHQAGTEDILAHQDAQEASKTPRVVAWASWTSFLFALLQSICTFFAAVDGLRLLIGVGALTLSAAVGPWLGRFHVTWIRIPMLVLALAGALLNLIVLAQIRWLRSRPAARWRQTHPSPSRLRMERIQFLLSIATLVLIAVEESLHIRWHGW